MEKLDKFDRKLLDVLQSDGDLSLDAIGDRVGLSRNACWRRIRALEATGVITGRTTLVNPEALGLGLKVFIMVRTNAHTADWAESFRKATRDMPQILGAYRMTGDLDYLIHARVADMADYDSLYQNLIRRVNLSDVSASFVMEQIKETHRLPV